ncbi:protein CASPARIAN STRIP INTEGRITY FACTOR 1 [Cicer arietinum]|uniref:Protein CASPARIAN STRIP INTEGRITY FACTOR 1 n=1 Tax=Cicer arietinum TaxID=3827 RepID=A0A1S2YWF6_CICAR|nr:protein CASPARIAN STRIP INTEGRITY FACTOR 1 [Cicer arietinum]
MDFMILKKFILLFLFIFGSLLETSFAGRGSNFIKISTGDLSAVQKVTTRNEMNEEEVSNIHERLLRANTKDYGRYDPTPTFSKPPFKLIPN